jgi:endonuclease YncB( thermonuclease family)
MNGLKAITVPKGRLEGHLYWYKAQVVDVVDGDTLDLLVHLGFTKVLDYPFTRFRVLDLDTHESSQRRRKGVKCTKAEAESGKRATVFAKEMLGLDPDDCVCPECGMATLLGAEVMLRTFKDDSKGVYGRYLAQIWALNAEEGQWEYYADVMKINGFDRNLNPL